VQKKTKLVQIHLAMPLAPNLKERTKSMKKLIILTPLLPAIALMFLTSCTTVVKEPTATTTTHTESVVTRTPTTTTVTRQTTGNY
jgi:hypothetical protein